MTTPRSQTMHALDDIHVPFVVASLLIGTLGGFTLAVSLPLEVLARSVDRSWLAHAQIHGHLQAVGFAGLFVIGMGLRLAPRFGAGHVVFPGLVRPAFILVLTGLLLRAVAQPLADHSPAAALVVVGMISELTGAALVLAVFAGTLAPALRTAQPHALLLCTSAAWLVVQAALGAWWVLPLAKDGRAVVLPAPENLALVNMQLFGVVLSAFLGVGLRTFPTFFGMPAPKDAAGLLVGGLLTAGVAAWTVGMLMAGDAGLTLADAGVLLVGAAILGAVATFGLGRLRHRMAPASRGFVWALQPVLFWLALVGVGLAAAGVRGLVGGSALSAAGLDALRHVFTLGVVTLGIAAMAQLILPEFASERIAHPPSVWRGAAFGIALSVAALLRGALPWAGLLSGDAYYRMMAVAGTSALLAVAAFGVLYWRARRRHVAYTARIAALRTGGRAAGSPTDRPA